MDTTADLKLMGVASVNGQPLACTGCGNTLSLEVHKHLVFETAPAWICCLACGLGADSTAVTNGLVDAVLAARTGRTKATDRDTFTAEWRGIVFQGECVPEFVLDDAVTVAKTVKQQATKDAKRWRRSVKQKVKARVSKATTNAAATAKAGALTAAWTVQTGGAGPATSTRRKGRRCSVKGCRKGTLTIRTRIHSTTGKTQTVKVPCAACGRAAGGGK